jgi:hypothetical protein
MNETPQHYTARILENLEGQDPRKILAATPTRLAQLIEDRRAAQLRKQPAPGKWSVAEILAHLADCEIVSSWRMRQILAAPGTVIQAFDQDSWAAAGHYGLREAQKSVDHFRALREANLALLKSLAPEQWICYGIHAERGQETITHIVNLQAGHDLNHIRQVEHLLPPRKS